MARPFDYIMFNAKYISRATVRFAAHEIPPVLPRLLSILHLLISSSGVPLLHFSLSYPSRDLARKLTHNLEYVENASCRIAIGRAFLLSAWPRR